MFSKSSDDPRIVQSLVIPTKKGKKMTEEEEEVMDGRQCDPMFMN